MGLLLYINRRTGVARLDRLCEAIAPVPGRNLRRELFDPEPAKAPLSPLLVQRPPS